MRGFIATNIRRATAIGLVVSLLLPMAGAAATPPRVDDTKTSIPNAFDGAIHSLGMDIASSPLYAFATGNGSRWVAEHAAPPNFNLVRPRPMNPQVTLADVYVRPKRAGIGIRGIPPKLGSENLGQGKHSTNRGPQLPTGSMQHGLTPKRAVNPYVNTSVTSWTGLNDYWTYEVGAVPGVGKWMVNIGSGNLVLQSDDVNVKERGINLAFRRTYNSLSQHDYANSDGSVRSNYGNGWTNNFDAHLGFDSVKNVLSVYDIDGARFDYGYTASGPCWTTPTGQFATLCWDGSHGYYWTKKNGTRYHFYSPMDTSVSPGYAGRLYDIESRDSNNSVTFNYFWDNGNSQDSKYLNQINVVHADGQILTMEFADYSGRRLLQSISRPDGQLATYLYDANGNLTDVCQIGNGAAHSPSDSACDWTTPHIHHKYGYGQNGAQPNELSLIDSGNWVMTNGAAGAYLQISYAASNLVSSVAYTGYENPTPQDGLNTPIQSGYPTTAYQYRVEYFSYSPQITNTRTTSYTDTDGHATTWTYDSTNRVSQTQEWNGNIWLTSSEVFDGQNNVISTIDVRGKETDYAYDLQGNTIAVALPSVTTTAGTFRPTSLYSYDQFSNIVSFCDPVFSNPNLNWVSRPSPSDSLCPSTSGTTRYSYDYSDSAEPFGRLSDSYTPLGYHRHFKYDPTLQSNVDAGLPTQIVGDSIHQADSTLRSPTMNLTYDALGNLICYQNGQGTFVVTYDALNRVSAAADPDDGSILICGKQSTPYTTTEHTYYNADNSIQETDAPNQPSGFGDQYSYDADGNQIAQVVHFDSSTSATYQKWFDADGRIVEVSKGWLSRYYYDLSSNSGVSLTGTGTFQAHGNLFATMIGYKNQGGVLNWAETKGTAYDPLDRIVTAYRWATSYPSPSPTVASKTLVYDDVPSDYGLQSSVTDEVGEKVVFSYDTVGREAGETFTGDGGVTPSLSVVYDPDGRIGTRTSGTLGTETLTYDADGNLSQRVEGTGVSSPAILTYDYYGDGLREDLKVTSHALTANPLLTYSYRVDGYRQQLVANDMPGAGTLKFGWTRTNGGRILTRSDTATTVNDYDSFGRLLDHTLPTSQGLEYQGSTYDYQNELVYQNEIVTDPVTHNTSTWTYKHTYDTLGELVGNETDSPINGNSYQHFHFVNGAPTTSDGVSCFFGCATTGYITQSPDPRYGASTTNVYKNPEKKCPGLTRTINYTYDPAGRQIAGSSATTNSTWNIQQNKCIVGNSSGSLVRAFDARNHVISEAHAGNYNGYSDASYSYTWGANGHPALRTSDALGSAQSPMSLHWDGDELLFVSDKTGNLYELNVEALAFGGNDGSFTGSCIVDRDTNGQTYYVYRNITGGSNCPGVAFSLPSPDTVSEGGPEPYLSDGPRFQGDRTVDSQNGQWTAPDPFGGLVSDPMTQRPFMWDHNNPVMYMDPTGYMSLAELRNIIMRGATSVWDFMLGDDIRTLSDPGATALAKACAIAGLLSLLGGPEIKGGDILAKLGAEGVEKYGSELLDKILAGLPPEGVYQFLDKNGQLYIGQSGNIAKRIMQHINSGKLVKEDIDTVEAWEVVGGRTARRIEEQTRINAMGGIENLSNKINSVRESLWKEWGIPGISGFP